jgi:crotonobetaine/carnitine-CoA ligase
MADFQFPELEDRTLPTILAHWAENAGDREYLQFGSDPASTFLEVEVATNRVAHSLARLGLTRGDRVAILAPNCLELVQTWFAAAKLGAVEVPVNTALRGKLLAHVLGNSGARILVVHASLRADVRDVVNAVAAITTVVVVGGSPEDARAAAITADRVLAFPELLEGSADALSSRPSYSDPMAILYTSGTTGPAKGAVMPHHQYYVWVELYARSLGLTNDDSYFTPLPLFHADGQLWGAYFPLVYGTKGTFEERFSVSRFWEQAKRSEATATNMLGAMVHMLWKQEPSPADRDHQLRVAQAIPMIPLKDDFQERFGLSLVTGYGQTETNWVSYDTETDHRDGSCGKVPSEFFEVEVVDELDEPVAAGEIGEIVVRPKLPWSISLGYHGNPEATQQTWRNLWFHSGDAGRLDEDGWLYFSDRIKDVIRRRGSNISAFELESVVDDHPEVLESAAFAVPSELSEDDVMVVVVTAPGSALEPADLHAYCVENLPKFMVPRYLEITTERLPRTPTEKISKPELRQRGVTPSTWDAGDR